MEGVVLCGNGNGHTCNCSRYHFEGAGGVGEEAEEEMYCRTSPQEVNWS